MTNANGKSDIRMVYRIESTEWQGWDDDDDTTSIGYADGKTNYDAVGQRFFAEKNAPEELWTFDGDPEVTFDASQGNELHNKIFVNVTISPAAMNGDSQLSRRTNLDKCKDS